MRIKRLILWMHKMGFASDRATGFVWKGFFTLAVIVLTSLTGLLRAQDDNSAPPPADGSTGASTTTAEPDASAATGPVTDDGSSAASDVVTFQTFYDSLAPLGTWIQTADYGYVWQPLVTDPDWAPYTDGHWVYTDDGWTWASDEPWGWATYHYGRWVNLDGLGWVWVPGYTWAPAWVSWRYGDGYTGWAPLPPDSFVGVDYSDTGDDVDAGFHIGADADYYYGIGPAYYVFLPINCLGYRHYHGYYCHRGDNFALINRTTNVTNINVAKRNHATNAPGDVTQAGRFHHVTVGGPSLAAVNAASSTPISKVNLVRANQPGGGTLTGNSLALYAPHVNPVASAQPSQVSSTIGHAKINRGTDILQPLAVNSRMAPTAATEAQVQQARIALNHTPADAKVVTDAASIKPVLQTPLTSLKPMARQQSSTTAFGAVSNSRPGAYYQTPTSRVYPQTAPGGNPNRVYPQNGVYPSAPSSNFQPHPNGSGTGGGTESHSYYARPTSPATTPQGAPSSPSVHQSQGGTSGGGGGSSHAESSGGSSGGGGERSGGGAPAGGSPASSGGGSGGGNAPSSGGGGAAGGGGGYRH